MGSAPDDRPDVRRESWSAGLSRQDRILGELAIARGLVPERVVEECARSFHDDGVAGAGPATSLSDVLVQRGHLSHEDARALEDQTLVVQAALPPDLKPGDQLGEFRIVRPLGQGGMGVVYEALQESLWRRVALKVLPPGHAANENMVVRFLREAHAIAGLNHPNLVPVYTSGQAQGVLYFAMEFIDGRSLEGLLADGPAAPARAARLVRGAALGLAHAHERGMVHRDIKPANILLDPDDQPRVTDFGLVREAGAATITRSAAVLGTPAYMSPEQARGETVDARSDVYGLGAVLYALLAGKAPYGDASTGSGNVLARVLTGPPSPLRALRPDVPPALEAIVERAMTRDREARYASAAALADDLDRFLDGQPVVAARDRARAHRRVLGRRVLLVAAAAAGLAVLAFAAARLGPRGAPPHTSTPRARSLRVVTHLPGRQLHPSLSPDGTLVVFDSAFEGNNDILLQRINAPESPVNLTRDCRDYDGQPAVSRDGRTIAFRSGRDGGGIFLMGLDGTGVRRLTTAGFDPAWSPDGKSVVFATDAAYGPTRRTLSELFVVDVATGATRRLRPVDAAQPAWSPGGKRIVYWSGDEGPTASSLWTIRPDGSGLRRLTSGPYADWAPAWSPDGRYVLFTTNRGGTSGIWRIALDETTGAPLGDPEPISLGAAGENLYVTLSADGRRLAFTSWNVRDTMKEVAFDPGRATIASIPRNISRQPRMSRSIDLSPDGRSIAYVDREGGERVIVADRNGENPRVVAGGGGGAGGRHRLPRWSPDGAWIAFQSDRGGTMQAWIVRRDGSGLRQVTDGPASALYPIWSPDGRRLAAFDDKKGAFVVDPWAEGSPRRREMLPPVPGTGVGFRASSWSADGRTIAGDAHGVLLFDVERRSYRRLTTEGAFPLWAGRGPWLVFWDNVDDRLRVVDSGSGQVKELLSEKPDQIGAFFGLSREGRTLLFTSSLNDGQIWVMDLQ